MRKRPNPRLSLDLLKGFEAAARHLSFTRAAAELFLTQPAISREIKTLERQLGQPLFTRVSRGLSLTGAGQELYRGVSEGLELIEAATRRAAGVEEDRRLTVTTSVPLASLWLAPRLPRFMARHRDVDVRIVAANKPLDLARERIDLAIRWFPPDDVPLPHAPLLFPMEVFPFCAPSLIRAPVRALHGPSDLKHHVLLEFEPATARPAWLDWQGWMRAMKIEGLRPAGMLRFSHYDQLIEAALESAGVALGRYPHIARQLREGRLVLPFGRDEVVGLGAYYILRAPGRAARALVEKFTKWLHEEVDEDAKQLPWREPVAACHGSSPSPKSGRSGRPGSARASARGRGQRLKR